jgi:disulfide bond formation protein DsbB
MDRKRVAYLLALAAPAALLAGAMLVFERMMGLAPCEMCWWQRYPLFAALAFAALGWATRRDALIALAGMAVLVSGLLGGFHAGVEYKWWPGPTHCTGASLGSDPLASIMNAPIVRCDVPQWALGGVSIAGFNFLISTIAGLAILWLIRRRGGARR